MSLLTLVFFFLIIRPPTISTHRYTLFPYTTLFRSLPRSPLPDFGLVRPEPRRWNAIRHRRHPERSSALLPTPRLRGLLQLDPDVARGRRRRAEIGEGGRWNHPVRDRLRASLPGLRGERSRLPATGRSAELVHMVRVPV